MLVSLCVIAFNEEDFLEGLFEDIKAQVYNHNGIELVLVNNGSNDKTKEIMERFATDNDFHSVKVVNREKGNQAAGWNTALLNASGDIIIKVDAHAKIPEDFVLASVNGINSGEAVCGGGRPNLPVKDKPWDNTLLVAEECMFGGGFARYRNVQQSKQYINSIYHGAYKAEVFAKVGGFNEALGRTEDNEFHHRLTQAGYKICCMPDIISYQYIRASLSSMLKQKYSNGFWIGLTLKKYPRCLSLFHLVPMVFVLALLACILFALAGFSLFLIMMTAMYLLFDMYITINALKSEKRCAYFAVLPFIFPALHIVYGIGTIVGIIHLPIRKDNLNRAMERIREVKSYYLERVDK